MTLKELASLVSKEEGKKHQASVGDVREIIKIVRDLVKKDSATILALLSKK